MPLAGYGEQGKMDRAEKMVINLRVGHGSAGFYMLEAQRMAREVEADLRKALFQIREVDKTFAKSKGRPDDRFLERATVKLTQCEDQAKALTTELEDSYLILKDNIQETLLQQGH